MAHPIFQFFTAQKKPNLSQKLSMLDCDFKGHTPAHIQKALYKAAHTHDT